jgi:hypothetical protein|tara:strand:- start:482 stop:754 length:273 start_codon:yes stop_codon:yes gene_type:complete
MSIVSQKTVLTQEELDTLRSLQQQFQKLQFELGEIEVVKISLEERYENAKKSLTETNKKEIDFSNSLKEKYGDISLNVETGEFSKLDTPS